MIYVYVPSHSSSDTSSSSITFLRASIDNNVGSSISFFGTGLTFRRETVGYYIHLKNNKWNK